MSVFSGPCSKKLSDRTYSVVGTVEFPKKLVTGSLYTGAQKEARREKFEVLMQLVISLRPVPQELLQWLQDSEVDHGEDELASDTDEPGATTDTSKSAASERGSSFMARTFVASLKAIPLGRASALEQQRYESHAHAPLPSCLRADTSLPRPGAGPRRGTTAGPR